MLPLLALSAGQATNLTNSAVLDPAGNFKISWEPLSAYGDIVIQLQAKAPGWLSLMIASPDGTYADLIWGGYINSTDTGYVQVSLLLSLYLRPSLQRVKLKDMHFDLTSNPLGHTAPIVDASNDVILQGAIYHEPWTIVRVKRSLATGDVDDVAIEVTILFSSSIILLTFWF